MPRRSAAVTATMPLLTLAAALPVSAQISVPPGFAVDQLVGRLDNSTPGLVAITDPRYGTGIITVARSSGVLMLRRIDAGGNHEVIGTLGGLGPTENGAVSFDDSGLLGGDLYLRITDGVNNQGTSKIYRLPPQTTAPIFVWESAPSLSFRIIFSDGSGGYTPGGYMLDGNSTGGSALWRMEPGPIFNELAVNSVPPGRTDVDINGMAFDRTGLYDHRMILADSDPNSNNLSAIYALLPDLTWQQISTPVSTQTRFYNGLSIAPGTGELGASVYVSETVSDTIMTVAPDGTHTIWASGFDGIGQAVAGIDGDSMFVSDFNGVYRIRPLADEPGPTLIAQTPSLPAGVHFSNPEGIASVRLIWSESVIFAQGDIEITRAGAGGGSVPFIASGSNSQFMLISFAAPLLDDTYTLTVHDTVTAVGGQPIDGDSNGIAGGDAVIIMAHQTCGPACYANCDSSTTAPVLNVADFTCFLQAFAGGCP